MRTLARWILRGVVTIVLLTGLFLTVITVLRIPVDLTRFKEPVELLASKGLGRPVSIEKSIVISTSLKPVFTLQGLRISNSGSFENPDFLYMDSARVQIALMPLFSKKVRFPEISIQGLDVTLEENEDGDVNWIFRKNEETTSTVETPETEDQQTVASPESPSKPVRKIEGDVIVLEKLDLQEISVDYFEQGSGDPVRFKMASCTGAMIPGKPLSLDIKGKLQSFGYTTDVSIASLDEFLRENRSWVEIAAEIAGTRLTMSGNVNLETAAKSLVLKTSVKGDNLASLNDLLHLDLPPFAAYQLDADLALKPKAAELSRLLVKTGSSSLHGSAHIEEGYNKTRVELKLQSPVLQINDFIFDDWNWSSESVDGDEVQGGNEEKNVSDKKKLFDAEILRKIDCSLSVEAEQVLSGEDLLGSGRLGAELRDGRVQVNPLRLNLPGGEILMSASLQPGKEQSEAELDVEIKNFDIGIYVRRKRPESDMGGLVNLDVYLRSSAASLPELLENGNGYFDFSGKLENFRSGVIDLWAVNLVAALVASTEKQQSQINCAVGRWSVENGLLTSDAFFVDTSKIRICAEGEVSLKDSRVDLEVAPRAKKAEFFSLATPVEIHGTFSDLNFGIGGAGVIGTAVKFIASPVTTPLKRVFSRKIPSNGRDVCNMRIGQVDRTEIFVPGCSPARTEPGRE